MNLEAKELARKLLVEGSMTSERMIVRLWQNSSERKLLEWLRTLQDIRALPST